MLIYMHMAQLLWNYMLPTSIIFNLNICVSSSTYNTIKNDKNNAHSLGARHKVEKPESPHKKIHYVSDCIYMDSQCNLAFVGNRRDCSQIVCELFHCICVVVVLGDASHQIFPPAIGNEYGKQHFIVLCLTNSMNNGLFREFFFFNQRKSEKGLQRSVIFFRDMLEPN